MAMGWARSCWAGIFFLVTGLGSLIFGIIVRAGYQPYRDGVQTRATVTSLTRNAGESDTFRPELTFTTNQGRNIVFNDTCSSSDAPSVGEEVRISYRPSDPYDVRNLDSRCKVLSWVLLLVGGVLLSGATLVVARSACLAYKRYTQRQRRGTLHSLPNAGANIDGHDEVQISTNFRPAFVSPETPKVQQLWRVGSMRWSQGEGEDEANASAGTPPNQEPKPESTEPQTCRPQDRDCAICYDAVPDHVMLPCGHGGFCGKCSTAMCTNTAAPHDKQAGHLCPVCRAPVHSISKVQLGTAKGSWSTAELIMTLQCPTKPNTTVDSQASVQSGN